MIFRKKSKELIGETRRRELYEYIRTHYGTASKKEIISFLTKHGWEKRTVNELILKVEKETAVPKHPVEPTIQTAETPAAIYPEKERNYLEKYVVQTSNFPVNIGIFKTPKAYTPVYDLKIKQISKETETVLEKIREELISQVSLGVLEIAEAQSAAKIKKKFEKAILDLIDKYFIDLDVTTRSYLSSFLIQKALGLGMIEFLLKDPNIE